MVLRFRRLVRDKMDPIAVLFDPFSKMMVLIRVFFESLLLLLRDYTCPLVSRLQGLWNQSARTIQLVHSELLHGLGTERRGDPGFASNEAFELSRRQCL